MNNNTKIEFVSINTVIADFYEDNRITQRDVNESLILKWADDMAEELTTDLQWSHSIAWLPVSNYKATLPKGLSVLLEVAYRLEKEESSCDKMGYQIVQYAQNTHGDDNCHLEMNVVCPTCHKKSCDCALDGVVVDINTAWEISHPEIFYSNYVKVGRFGYGNSIYSNRWQILCHTDNDWFGLNKTLPDCSMIHCRECPHTYKLTAHTIETSFEEGEILVSYLGKMMDENGDLMIPKHRHVFEAILQHLTYKWYRAEYLSRRDPSDRAIYQEALVLRDQAVERARSAIGMPSFDEFSKFWSKSIWNKLDSAYQNLMDGNINLNMGQNVAYSDLNYTNKNIYKS